MTPGPLPCPFCGDVSPSVDWTRTATYAYCSACDADGPEVPVDLERFDEAEFRRLAIEAWNRRAEPEGHR